MGEKESKSIYNKWWFWLIAFFAILTIYGAITGVNQAIDSKEDPTKEEQNNEDVVIDEPEVGDETEDVSSVIEHDDELLFGEYTINNIKTEIKNSELKLMFDWINQSGRDDIPFTAVGYFDVMQGEEILKEISGAFDPTTNSDVLRKADNGIISPVTLKYELKNNEPIKVQFGATHEIDDTKEELIVEID